MNSEEDQKNRQEEQERISERMKHYMKGMDTNDTKRKINQQHVELRRNNREELFMKRRNIYSNQQEKPIQQSSHIGQESHIQTQQLEQEEQVTNQNISNMEVFMVELDKKEYQKSDLPQLARSVLYPQTHEELLEAVFGIRKILSTEDSPPCQEVTDLQIHQNLIQLIDKYFISKSNQIFQKDQNFEIQEKIIYESV